MRKQQLITEIKKNIVPIIESQGIDLVDFELKGGTGNQILRVYVDVEGGVSIDSCVELSRQISDRLDVADVMPGKYRLEVSSPGVDRPLKTIRDFQRNIGHQVNLHLTNGTSAKGRIKKVDDNSIFLEREEEEFIYSMDKISSGKIMLQW
jgi:ribosome maturation factor RimP